MAVMYVDGVLDRDARPEQRGGIEVEVRGLSAVPSLCIVRVNGVEVGRATDAARVTCDLTRAPLGGVTLTARYTVNGISSTLNRSTTIVPDPVPGPTNTGVRLAEDALEPHAGGWITTPTDFVGRLFTAPVVPRVNVTFTDCLFRYGANSGGTMVNASAHAGYAHCSFDALASGGIKYAVGTSNFELLNCDVYGAMDGVRVNTNVVIRDSWVHDLTRYMDFHPDCIQTTNARNVLIEHNNLDSYERGGGLGNAAIQLGGETRDQSINEPGVVDFFIRDNWLRGGNYTVNARTDAAPGPLELVGNRLYVERNPDGTLVKVPNSTGELVGKSPRYGSFARPKATVVPGWTVADNVEQDGRPITVRYW